MNGKLKLTYVGDLKSANQTPVTVRPNTPLSVAKDTMRKGNFSQLPVVENGNNLVGVISWQSIGSGGSSHRDSEVVSEYMDDHSGRVFTKKTRLPDVVGVVADRDYILVEDDGRLSGIVTPYDLLQESWDLPTPITPNHADTPTQHDVRSRLDEFRKLEDGWLDGQGLAPSQSGLDWLTDSFDRHYPPEIGLPHLYPTFEGGIQAEWSFPTREINLEVNLQTHQADWYNLDLESDEDEIKTLNLDDDDMWGWIARKVVGMVGSLHE